MADENVPLQGSKSLKGALCPSYLMNDGIRSMFQEKFKVPVLEYYDVPEMTGITHMQPADRNQIRQGSVGRPLRGVTQKIVDEATGEDLEHGKVGLLLLGGNQITRGYFPAEGTEGNFSGNMLKTGDMARIDEDGYLYVTDYHREFLISRDVIVSPGEIEKFLSQVEGVSEAAVIGLDTGQGDQKIVAGTCQWKRCFNRQTQGSVRKQAFKGEGSSRVLPQRFHAKEHKRKNTEEDTHRGTDLEEIEEIMKKSLKSFSTRFPNHAHEWKQVNQDSGNSIGCCHGFSHGQLCFPAA
jgi:acyl-CoA synthetase (AMP-forming)/AMP-acid ligase II